MREPIIDIKRVARKSAPLPYAKISRELLPARYELSLVICADALARRMNRTYRHKDYSPNVLSFPLDKNQGEIFLNARKAEREARMMGITPRERMAHLFAHGCLHLIGMKHGKRMDREERRVLKKFGFWEISHTF